MGGVWEVVKSYFESFTLNSSISTSWGIIFYSEWVANNSKIVHICLTPFELFGLKRGEVKNGHGIQKPLYRREVANKLRDACI
jgi:hypothetical protein